MNGHLIILAYAKEPSVFIEVFFIVQWIVRSLYIIYESHKWTKRVFKEVELFTT